MALFRPLKENRRARPVSTPLSFGRSIRVMSLALCPRVVSRAPQHFRFSVTQAACDVCLARQSSLVCIVAAQLSEQLDHAAALCMSVLPSLLQLSSMSNKTR